MSKVTVPCDMILHAAVRFSHGDVNFSPTEVKVNEYVNGCRHSHVIYSNTSVKMSHGQAPSYYVKNDIVM
jgi:hypothetical protein